MKRVKLVTFKGCQSTVDLREALEELIDAEGLDATVELALVPSPEKATEMGLFGSPTILVDGVELHKEHRPPAGFF